MSAQPSTGGARTVGTAPVRRRLVICEPVRAEAQALRRLFDAGPSLAVVGIRETAEAAISSLSTLDPDLLVISSSLPGMTGIHAVEQIMSTAPLPILVLVGGDDDSAAAEAVSAGAVEAQPKQHLIGLDPGSAEATSLRRRLVTLSNAPVIRHPRARLRSRPRHRPESREVAAVGFCASTGGPQALAKILSGLPSSYPVPILVVQHIAAGFAEGLCSWLGSVIDLPVALAGDGMPLRPGVWIAPPEGHLVVDPAGRELRLDTRTVGSVHRPSGDFLFESMARAFGPAAVGVVLTGMGRDGAQGVHAIRGRGGVTLAQDSASAAIFGMPKAAAESGAQLVLSPEEIVGQLAALRPRR